MPNKKRLLIVEDEEDIREMLKLRLEANDYEVMTASDGQEALDVVYKEKLDLIILDLMLPKIDGYKVCGLLKRNAKYAKIPIIIFTARAHEDMIKEEIGADAYITKPFQPQVLLDQIKELIKEK